MYSRIALFSFTVLVASGCLPKAKGVITTGGAVTEPPPAPPAGKIDYLFPTGTTNFLGKIRLVATISDIKAPKGNWKAALDGGTVCSGSLSPPGGSGVIEVDCRMTATPGSHQVQLVLYGEDGKPSVSSFRTIRSATDTCAGSVPNAMNLTPPATLSQTCLYDSIANKRPSESMRPYTPQFQLWTDASVKKRWIYLPPGAQINTADQENWVFPAGTRLFKEFRQDGKLVETRMLVKTAAAAGAASWVAATYAWRADQTDADLSAGAANTLGTVHDIPGAAACTTCHQGAADFVLGFDAIQLSRTAPLEETNFASLRADALITNIPTSDYTIAGTPAQQAAVGYLHANCSACHNPIGAAAGLNLNFKHNLAAATHAAENAFVTGTGQGAVTVGDATNSRVVIRMSTRPGGMPPIGTKLSDPTGLATIREWILGL